MYQSTYHDSKRLDTKENPFNKYTAKSTPTPQNFKSSNSLYQASSFHCVELKKTEQKSNNIKTSSKPVKNVVQRIKDTYTYNYNNPDGTAASISIGGKISNDRRNGQQQAQKIRRFMQSGLTVNP